MLKVNLMPADLLKVNLRIARISSRLSGLEQRRFDPLIRLVAEGGWKFYCEGASNRTDFEKALIRTAPGALIKIGRDAYIMPRIDKAIRETTANVSILVATCGVIGEYSRVFHSLTSDDQAKLFLVMQYLASVDSFKARVFSASNFVKRLSMLDVNGSKSLISDVFSDLRSAYYYLPERDMLSSMIAGKLGFSKPDFERAAYPKARARYEKPEIAFHEIHALTSRFFEAKALYSSTEMVPKAGLDHDIMILLGPMYSKSQRQLRNEKDAARAAKLKKLFQLTETLYEQCELWNSLKRVNRHNITSHTQSVPPEIRGEFTEAFILAKELGII